MSPLYGDLPSTAATFCRPRRGPGASPSGSGPPRTQNGRRGQVGNDAAWLHFLWGHWRAPASTSRSQRPRCSRCCLWN